MKLHIPTVSELLPPSVKLLSGLKISSSDRSFRLQLRLPQLLHSAASAAISLKSAPPAGGGERGASSPSLICRSLFFIRSSHQSPPPANEFLLRRLLQSHQNKHKETQLSRFSWKTSNLKDSFRTFYLLNFISVPDEPPTRTNQFVVYNER